MDKDLFIYLFLFLNNAIGDTVDHKDMSYHVSYFHAMKSMLRYVEF